MQKDRKDLVSQAVHFLHVCRNKEMFDAFGKVVVTYLQSVGESAYASWLQNEYLVEPYATWYS